jgi:small subunit ribosomal protein S8
MSSTDPIADLLTRLRNASAKFKDRVDVPSSKLKLEIVRILKEQGFIANYKTLHEDNPMGTLRIFFKYSSNKEPVLRGIKRISRPSLRVYRSFKNVPRRGAFVVTLLSTSKGVLTDKQALEKKVGGEVLCQVW